MSMADVKRSFSAGLGGSGVALTGATLTYERNDDQDRTDQRLNFTVTKPDGASTLITELIDGRDPVSAARLIAEQFVASLTE
ncbi:hypothetical protein [Filomicrobium sp.]|uniref:hypothetical protein n=1 Tax=Filomicrobium sp. TaxID=2024831 RepID=UPI0025838463|nr:hypothetical protein [Filomicrobium sp.]MCV0371729.1 hypothetical protein [Filomicrobium sp.]